MTDTIETVHLTERYSIMESDTGEFYAIRNTEPKFCFHGYSLIGAIRRAEAALEMYRSRYGESQ